MKPSSTFGLAFALATSAHHLPPNGFNEGHGAITKKLSPGMRRVTCLKHQHRNVRCWELFTNTITAAQSLFGYSTQLGDSRYEPYYHQIWYPDMGNFATRFTAWYIPGLFTEPKVTM